MLANPIRSKSSWQVIRPHRMQHVRAPFSWAYTMCATEMVYWIVVDCNQSVTGVDFLPVEHSRATAPWSHHNVGKLAGVG